MSKEKQPKKKNPFNNIPAFVFYIIAMLPYIFPLDYDPLLFACICGGFHATLIVFSVLAWKSGGSFLLAHTLIAMLSSVLVRSTKDLINYPFWVMMAEGLILIVLSAFLVKFLKLPVFGKKEEVNTKE